MQPAAQTASSVVSSEPARPSKAKQGRTLLYYVAGYIISATVGLSIGYVLMCMINPDANFLNLPIPGAAAPSEPAPEAGS